MEAGAGGRGEEQEGHGRQPPAEGGGITPQKLSCYLYLTYFIMIISSLSAIGNGYLVLTGKATPVGTAGWIASVVFLIASIFAWAIFDSHQNAKRVRNVTPKIDPHIQELVRAATQRVVSPGRQVSAIDSGNPSAASPADPAMAGPSGLQPPAPHAPDEHSYRTLRSGKKIPVSESRHSESQSVLQAPVSRESSASRSISEVAISLSQITAARMGGRKRALPNRKASIHEESLSEDSDDSALD